MRCGLTESSFNGNDSQLRLYIYLKDMPVVWRGTLSVSEVDFYVASVAQTESLDKLQQILEANNDRCF